MKLNFAVLNNNHQTLIRLLRNYLLPKGEGIFSLFFELLIGSKRSWTARLPARKECEAGASRSDTRS